MAGLYDMVKMTVTGTPGTGTITLNAAVAGFQTFAAAGVVSGQTVSYSALDQALWEVGRGVYTTSGTTLTRGALFSSAGGGAVSLTTNATVWIALLAEDLQPSPVTGISAAGNNVQGSATVLTSVESYVSTVGTTTNGVLIPAKFMIPGTPSILVVNEGANLLNCFGDTGVSINGGSANASISISVGVAALFKVKSSTSLRTVP
jgi:hypothetical protein